MRKLWFMKPCHQKFILGWILCVSFIGQHCTAAEHLVSVKKFGAVADAHKVKGVWIGTDNSDALNKCAAYCRANGLTMFFPRGNYGVASTVWLTNPDKDRLKQASITVVGSNRGAFGLQRTSANVCTLKSFKSGGIVEVKKRDGVVREPDIVPILAISNGRQVHIEGLGIHGANMEDLICGIAIGNISQMTSVRYCSIYDTYAGIVFPGLRPSTRQSVVEGNNDLLVVEQTAFGNTYNIVCAGTQPFACEYRSSRFLCVRSVFTGRLITNEYRQTRGSHKFSSNLFGSLPHSPEQETVYFDLLFSEITIDSCHFETGWKRTIPEVLVRYYPYGGVSNRSQQFALTNNIINFPGPYRSPSKYRPLIDTMVGNRMIIQGNNFQFGSAARVKAYGAVLIGNAFNLRGPYNLELTDDEHVLVGSAGNIERGLYDFNHFIRKDSQIKISLPDGTSLRKGLHYKVNKDANAFEITPAGKERIDNAKTNRVLVSYRANDAHKVQFETWGGNKLNPPHGWRSKDLTLIANKIIGRTDKGEWFEGELKANLPTSK
jgi:hypothetical protein